MKGMEEEKDRDTERGERGESEKEYWQRGKRAAQEKDQMEQENKRLRVGGGNAEEWKCKMKRQSR